MTLKLRFKFDALPVKADRVIDVSFPVLRHVGDVTVGGRSVCSTSGLTFLVEGNLNRSTFSGVLLVSAYFRFGNLLEIGKKNVFESLVCHIFRTLMARELPL